MTEISTTADEVITFDMLEEARKKATHNKLDEIQICDRAELAYKSNLSPDRAGLSRFKKVFSTSLGSLFLEAFNLYEQGYRPNRTYSNNVDCTSVGGFRLVMIKPEELQQKDIQLLREEARNLYVKQIEDNEREYNRLKSKANGQIKQLQQLKNQIEKSSKFIKSLDEEV